MNKLITDVEQLLKFEHSERDTKILQGLQEHGSVPNFLRASDFKKRTVQRRLAAMRKSAERFGYNKQFPQAGTVLDQPIHGKSQLVKFDPPLPDGTILQWNKTKSEDVTLAHMIKSLVDGLQIKPAKPTSFKGSVTTKTLPLLTLADVHLGMLAYSPETGAESNLEITLEILMKAVDHLVDKMDYVDIAILVNLGDLTHTDGLIAKTARSSNPLDASARYFEICRAAGQLLRYTVEKMLDKAKNVVVYNIRGNHDDQTAWHINETLQGIYSKEPRVSVPGNDAYTQMFTWEDNMVVMTHGDAAKNSKMYEYVTTKWPKEFGNAAHSYVMKGHVHHARYETIGNMAFETFSTLTRSDAYHEFKMYKSLRSMSLVNLHPQGGEDSRHTYIPRIADE